MSNTPHCAGCGHIFYTDQPMSDGRCSYCNAESAAENHCPHLREDKDGHYCGKDLSEGEDEIRLGWRRAVCSSPCVQLWCADQERFDKCIYYINGWELGK